MQINWYPLEGDGVAFQVNGGDRYTFASSEEAETHLKMLVRQSLSLGDGVEITQIDPNATPRTA